MFLMLFAVLFCFGCLFGVVFREGGGGGGEGVLLYFFFFFFFFKSI